MVTVMDRMVEAIRGQHFKPRMLQLLESNWDIVYLHRSASEVFLQQRLRLIKGFPPQIMAKLNSKGKGKETEREAG